MSVWKMKHTKQLQLLEAYSIEQHINNTSKQ